MSYQVQEAIEAWRDILPAKEQAELEAEIEREEVIRQMQAQARQGDKSGATPGSVKPKGKENAEASDSSDDEGPVVTEELNLDQAIAVSVTSFSISI